MCLHKRHTYSMALTRWCWAASVGHQGVLRGGVEGIPKRTFSWHRLNQRVGRRPPPNPYLPIVLRTSIALIIVRLPVVEVCLCDFVGVGGVAGSSRRGSTPRAHRYVSNK